MARIGLVASILLFTAGLYFAVRSAPEALWNFRIVPFLVVLCIIQPASNAINVVDFRVMVRMAGGRVSWGRALQTVIYARAASSLPIPGGFIVRLGALKLHAVPFGRGSLLIALLTGLWGALAFVYAGVWLNDLGIMLGFVAVGLLGLAICALLVYRLRLDPRLVAIAGTLRVLALVLEAISLIWAAKTLGIHLTFEQTSVFVVSSFLATAAIIAPNGLGVREAVIALLSPLVDIDPATGFLVATVGRVAGMLGMAVIASTVYLVSLRTRGARL